MLVRDNGSFSQITERSFIVMALTSTLSIFNQLRAILSRSHSKRSEATKSQWLGHLSAPMGSALSENTIVSL